MTTPALDRLVERHAPELFAYLCRMLQEHREAEDCLQETFLRAYKAYGRLDSGANQRAWLYRIATRVALTQLKRRGRHERRTVPLDAEPERSEAGAGAPDPFEAAADRQLLARVAKAVERLPERQRTALVLRNYQSLSYAEIALALGGTPEAARANVYQALKKLRAELAPLKDEVSR